MTQPQKKMDLNVVICGALEVGKTSLSQCFVNPKNQSRVKHQPTKIVHKTTFMREIDNVKCHITFSDMAGNLEAQYLVQDFCKSANCIVLCYSLTEALSFDSHANWIEEIDRNPDFKDIPIALIATKSDLADTARDVQENQGLRLKNYLGPRCFLFEKVTTYTDDFDQIERVREKIIKKAKKHWEACNNVMKERMPSSTQSNY